MEDEDMKKETQNLAYPPAFKLGKLLSWLQTNKLFILTLNGPSLSSYCIETIV